MARPTDPDVPGIDTSTASPARMYDYYLGGRDNFPADRAAAEAVIADHPQQRRLARNNRAFLRRAVAHLAEAGIDQYIDIGTGIPTSPNVHEVARAAHPAARVAYVDDDPVVLSHARALLSTDAHIAVVDADMHDRGLSRHPEIEALVDFERPVGVLFVAVLHFSPGTEPARIVRAFRERMVAGSYLVLSAGSTEGLCEAEVTALREAYASTPRGAFLRPREEIEALFEGFELLDPGLTDVSGWRADEPPTPTKILAGVGRRI